MEAWSINQFRKYFVKRPWETSTLQRCQLNEIWEVQGVHWNTEPTKKIGIYNQKCILLKSHAEKKTGKKGYVGSSKQNGCLYPCAVYFHGFVTKPFSNVQFPVVRNLSDINPHRSLIKRLTPNPSEKHRINPDQIPPRSCGGKAYWNRTQQVWPEKIFQWWCSPSPSMTQTDK